MKTYIFLLINILLFFSAAFSTQDSTYAYAESFSINVNCVGEIDDDPGTTVSIKSISEQGVTYLVLKANRSQHSGGEDYEDMKLLVKSVKKNRLSATLIKGLVVEPFYLLDANISFVLNIPKIKSNLGYLSLITGSDEENPRWDLHCK